MNPTNYIIEQKELIHAAQELVSYIENNKIANEFLARLQKCGLDLKTRVIEGDIFINHENINTMKDVSKITGSVNVDFNSGDVYLPFLEEIGRTLNISAGCSVDFPELTKIGHDVFIAKHSSCLLPKIKLFGYMNSLFMHETSKVYAPGIIGHFVDKKGYIMYHQAPMGHQSRRKVA
jgi:hypothetical protein